MARIIAVAGNLASGKSTLAGVLSRNNGWRHFPRRGYDVSYIEDLFRDPERWAFEAQMSFLRHKADAIREIMALDGTVVLDRSIDEDVSVFARYFHQRGWMSDRSYGLYQRYARQLLDSLAPPSVVVYCSASPTVCAERLSERPRLYQQLYPPDHVDRLHRLYETWWAEVEVQAKLVIDTTTNDVREASVGRDLARRIATMLEQAMRGPVCVNSP